MSRLAEDIALLARVADICGRAVYPEPQVNVPPQTLDALADEIAAARRRVAEYPLIGDEALCLVIAAQHVTWARIDGNDARRERWQRLGELLCAAIALDLDNARKSIGEVA